MSPKKRRAAKYLTQFCRRLGLYFGICKKAFSDLRADGCFTQAAAISYYLVVSIFPMLLLIIGVAGFILEPREVQNQVLDWLHRYFPAGTRAVFRDNLQSIVEARNSINIIGFITLLWSSTLMFDAINEAVNAAWGAKRQARFLIGKLKSLLLIFVFVLASINPPRY